MARSEHLSSSGPPRSELHWKTQYAYDEQSRGSARKTVAACFRDAWCANESLVLFDTDETAKSCAPWEKFCVVRDVNRYCLSPGAARSGADKRQASL